MPPIQQTEEQKKAAFAAADVPLPQAPIPAPAVPGPVAPAPASVVPVEQSEEQRKAAFAAAGVPLPTTGTNQPAQYTVQTGDTVDAIAKRFGVPRANVQGFRSRDPNTIFPGENLTIQSPTVPQAQPVQPVQPVQQPQQTPTAQTTQTQQALTPTISTPSSVFAQQKAQEQQFFGQFGVSSDKLEQNFGANPFATVGALIKQTMQAVGLPDIREQITTFSKEIEDLANERDDLIAKEQDNPFISAGTKSGRAKQIEDRYERKLSNRINRLTLLQNAYQDARQQAEFVTTQAVALYDKERTIQANNLQDALDRAEKQAESEKKLQAEAGKIDYSIQDVGGRTVRFGFDKSGQPVSKVDLGLAKAPQGGELPGVLTPKQTSVAIQLANSLKSHPAYTDMQDIATGISGVETGLAQKNGFGDITAINSFQRMVDPGATVREGDVALIQTASAFLNKVLSDYPIEKLQKGSKLPEATRQQMLKTATELYERRAKNYNESVGSQYKSLSGGAGIPFEFVGQDFSAKVAPSVNPTKELDAILSDTNIPDAQEDAGGFFDKFLGVFGLQTK